jgi:hypothetical protein
VRRCAEGERVVRVLAPDTLMTVDVAPRLGTVIEIRLP